MQRAELYSVGKPNLDSNINSGNSDDEIFLADSSNESPSKDDAMSALITFFGSARFANHPRHVMHFHGTRNNNTSGHNFYNRRKAQLNHNDASSIGCFNCGKQNCSVATCTQPRDPKRIANNISKWRELRKLDKSAKININTVPHACHDSSEANEVMVAALFAKQYEDNTNDVDDKHEADPFIYLNETLQNNVLQHINSDILKETQKIMLKMMWMILSK